VRALYREVLSREPEPAEVLAALNFIGQQASVPREPRSDPTWQYGHGYFDYASGKVIFSGLPVFADQGWKGGAKLPDPQLGWVC
jgi:hypothetical protein